MAQHRRSEILAGLFVLLAVAAFTAFAFQVGGLDRLALFRSRSVEFTTSFPSIQTLAPGAKVTVGGRRVGTVLGFEWTDRPYPATPSAAGGDGPRPERGDLRPVVEVRFALDDPGLRLDPASASVSLRQDGILGQFGLELDPGFWKPGGAPPRLFEADWPQDAPTALRSTATTGLEDVLGSMQAILQKIDDAVEHPTDGNLIGQLLTHSASAARRLGELLDAERDDGVRRALILPTRAVLEKADAVLATVQEELSGGFFDRAEATLVAANDALGEARELLRTNRPRVERVLDELESNSRELGRAIRTGRGILEDNRANLAESTRRLRRALWEAEMALRKIRANPAYLLYGDEETDLEARPVDLSGIRSTGRSKPYGQRDEGGR